jgi:hypothetical protein
MMRETSGPKRRVVVQLLGTGVALIFGGEASCILGPDVSWVHIACHAALYSGVLLVAVGVVLEARSRLRATRTPHSGADT